MTDANFVPQIKESLSEAEIEWNSMAKLTPDINELLVTPFPKRIEALSGEYALFALAVQVPVFHNFTFIHIDFV
jgi:hypothetical protein